MLNFKTAHIFRNPAGSYSVAGRVPETCLDVHTPPTAAEVMGGRWFERDGITYGWKGKAFPTREAAQAAVDSATVSE